MDKMEIVDRSRAPQFNHISLEVRHSNRFDTLSSSQKFNTTIDNDIFFYDDVIIFLVKAFYHADQK